MIGCMFILHCILVLFHRRRRTQNAQCRITFLSAKNVDARGARLRAQETSGLTLCDEEKRTMTLYRFVSLVCSPSMDTLSPSSIYCVSQVR